MPIHPAASGEIRIGNPDGSYLSWAGSNITVGSPLVLVKEATVRIPRNKVLGWHRKNVLRDEYVMQCVRVAAALLGFEPLSMTYAYLADTDEYVITAYSDNINLLASLGGEILRTTKERRWVSKW